MEREIEGEIDASREIERGGGEIAGVKEIR